MRDEFSTLDIVKALGIPRERLREWMTRSFIKPTISAQGQGTKASFSRLDVYCVELFRQLVEEGFDRDKSRMFVDFYKTRMKSDEGRLNYLIIRLGPIKTQGGVELEPTHSAFFAVPGDKLLLDEGCVDSSDLTMSRSSYGNRWSIMHLVNLKALRNKTDLALKKA